MDRSVRRFLDLEARQDDDNDTLDSEEEHELNDHFLDDGLELDDHPSNLPAPIAKQNECHEAALDRLVEKILSTTQGGRATAKFNCTYEDDGPAVGNALRMPREDDYPLWRVKCRIGTEEIAVLSLLGTAAPRHELRAAFTRGSVRGNIYLECTMNRELINLLRITPGVIRGDQGVLRWMVDFTEQVSLLRMKNSKVEVEAGSWVLVKKGLYSGDVGVVSAVHSWGACLLLVPRLNTTLPELASQSRKRKASVMKPAAKLFDPQLFLPSSPPRIVSTGENSYSVGLLQFQHGLVAKEFDFHSFSNDVRDIPYHYHRLFVQSHHPLVVTCRMPRPCEWFFKENDQVLLSTGQSGRIRSIGAFTAEINLSDPTQSITEWIDQVPWHNIRKHIKVGQYICAHAGPHAGIAGWVIGVRGEFATLVTKVAEGEILDHNNALNFVDVLVNCSEVTEPPAVLHSQQPIGPCGIAPDQTPNPLAEKAFRHPWCGLEVKISRKSHPKKGATGVIKEVTGRLDGTDAKLVIQLTAYNPSAPFQTITVAYHDVVELKSYKELARFMDPGPGFCRPRPQPLKKDNNPRKPPSISIPTGSQTPLPTTPDASEGGAWDPSSRTPGPWDHADPPSFLADGPSTSERLTDSPRPPSSSISLSSSSSSALAPVFIDLSAPPVQNHVLLNSRLVGASLNVIVNGGGFANKELAASVFLGVEAVPALRYVKYRTSTFLKPEWVTPKYPNPTHDNGLLIVIRGEHCGKYVRRIHHQRENGLVQTVIVAVVTRCDGQPDALTGEQLELGVEYLCTVAETRKQKDMNWNVMQETREHYRKTHR